MSKLSFHIRILVGLGVSLVLCLILIAQFGRIGKVAWENYQLHQQPLQKIASADILLQEQRVELEKLTSRSQQNGNRLTPLNSHFQFVEYLTQKSQQQGVKMISLPTEKKEILSGYELIEDHFSVSGKLPAIMRFLYQLEVEDQVGRMVYLNVERRKIRIRANQRILLVADIKINRIQKL
ncbi:MAG: hypothetical protein AAGC85_04280 [Bacteroidota bacterium]